MLQNKVSIVTPCYNGAKYLDMYFKGIMSQSHRNIELIFVNDGSTDETETIALHYGRILKEHGIQFIYVVQEHSGQAAAMNKGIARYSGDYFTWLDADDIMEPDNIKRKLEYLETHSDCGFVMNAIQFVDEKDISVRISGVCRKLKAGEDNLFRDYIYAENVVWVPGTVMVRRSCLTEALSEGSIYESKEGQNWQMMLPLAYLYRCGYLEDELLKCVCHSDSHSRMDRSFEEQILREKNFIVLCIETVSRIRQMSDEEKQKWFREIRIVHKKNILGMAVKHHKIRCFYKTKKELAEDDYRLKLTDDYFYLILRNLYHKICK